MTNPKPFWQSGTLHGNVALNCRGLGVSELDAFAGAYRKAARHLADRLEGATSYSDFDACPIVFLYRHSLELYLKAVVHLGCVLAALNSEPFPFNQAVLEGHKLTPLADPVFEIFRMAGWGPHIGVPGIETQEDLRKLLIELDEIDDGSFAFRYPADKKHRVTLPQHFVFNVLDVARRLDALLELLDAGVTGLLDIVGGRE